MQCMDSQPLETLQIKQSLRQSWTTLQPCLQKLSNLHTLHLHMPVDYLTLLCAAAPPKLKDLTLEIGRPANASPSSLLEGPPASQLNHLRKLDSLEVSPSFLGAA